MKDEIIKLLEEALTDLDKIIARNPQDRIAKESAAIPVIEKLEKIISICSNPTDKHEEADEKTNLYRN